MAFIINKKKKDKNNDIEIKSGKVYEIPSSDRNITVNTRKTQNVLTELNQTRTNIDAIEYIVDKLPDGKMALNTYLRLANQGFKVEFVNRKNNRPIKKYDAEWRTFCSTIGGNTSSGLDGLIDQLHRSEIIQGGQAVEVVVDKSATEIESVIVIPPKTITKFEWIDSENRWAAYQEGAKVDLYSGNFFWIPHQPKPGRPEGTLQFEPAIVTMTEFYQLIKDSLVVLNRIGYPKYDIKVLTEKLASTLTPAQKSDPEKLKKAINDIFEEIRSNVSSINLDSSFIHFDSTEVDTVGGGVNGSGIDVRAWFEVLEPLIVNSFQLTPVLMGRLKTGSYSLGTAEYKIVKDNMEVIRRNSKRMVENIANIWARVHGYNIYAVMTHNPIEWEIEKEKLEAHLLKMEKARRAEEYGYVGHDQASTMALGDDADPQPVQLSLYEYIKKVGEKPSSNTGKGGEEE